MNISLSFLADYPDLNLALELVLKTSKKSLKESSLPRSLLSRPISAGQTLSLPLDLINRQMISPLYEGPPIEILFEDDHFLVLNKPAHIHTHPLRYSEGNNCLSFLRSRGPTSLLEVNPLAYERGLLYRLDYGTTGVLIYVKSADLLAELRKNFRQRVVAKIYLAVVSGDFCSEGVYTHHLLASGPKGHKMKISAKGQLATAEFRKVSYAPARETSLVKITLLTGVRHQIRAQLAYLGYPIVGDDLYAGKSAERLHLHASQYDLNYPQNYSFLAPAPFT